MDYKSVKFNTNNSEFFATLNARVRLYFKDKNVSRYANTNMVLKSIFMILLYFVPYILLLSNVLPNIWWMLFLYLIMGFGKAGIGLSILHDANHGSYSKNQTINNIMGYMMNIVGGSALNWKIQHNVLHHTYTNIEGVDEDIAIHGIMRFSPHEKRRAIHRVQYIYAWFLYGLLTLSWALTKDYKQLIRYNKMGLIEAQGTTFTKAMINLIISKVLYYLYMVVIPIIVLPIAWWQVLLLFVFMHFIAGLTLSCIFQPAHVVPESEYPLPEGGVLSNNWAIHQLYNTTNFAPKSRLFSWYIGGLNYQIEHHLFPNISHVHYKKLSEIVKQTASEFNLPYNSQSNFVMALWSHAKMLYMLGRNDYGVSSR